MTDYYVNDHEQTNGDHEVHHSGCMYFPLIVSKAYLGAYSNAIPAVIEARINHYVRSNGCAYCSPEAHTS